MDDKKYNFIKELLITCQWMRDNHTMECPYFITSDSIETHIDIYEFNKLLTEIIPQLQIGNFAGTFTNYIQYIYSNFIFNSTIITRFWRENLEDDGFEITIKFPHDFNYKDRKTGLYLVELTIQSNIFDKLLEFYDVNPEYVLKIYELKSSYQDRIKSYME